MNVSLTPELEAFVEETVKSGRYASASEAVREGLRLLAEREAKFMALKRDIERGMASPEAGNFDHELADAVKKQGRAALSRLRAAE